MRWPVFAFTLLLCLSAVRPARAVNPEHFSVFLDGKPILSGRILHPGNRAIHLTWRDLKFAGLKPEKDFVVTTDPDRPLQAVLKGEVQVKLLDRKNDGEDPKATQIKLYRKEEKSIEWYFDPDWIESVSPPERRPPPEPAEVSPLMWGVIGGLALVAGVVVTVGWRRYRRDKSAV